MQKIKTNTIIFLKTRSSERSIAEQTGVLQAYYSFLSRGILWDQVDLIMIHFLT